MPSTITASNLTGKSQVLEDGKAVAIESYVTSAVDAMAPKPGVRLATTASLGWTYSEPTLTSPDNGPHSFDNVALAATNRVLVKDEGSGTGAANGVYVVTQLGDGSSQPTILTRADDSSTVAEIDGSLVFVLEGDTLAGNGYAVDLDGTDIATATKEWSQFTSAAAISAGTGLTGSLEIDYSVNATWTASQTFGAGMTTTGGATINQGGGGTTNLGGGTASLTVDGSAVSVNASHNQDVSIGTNASATGTVTSDVTNLTLDAVTVNVNASGSGNTTIGGGGGTTAIRGDDLNVQPDGGDTTIGNTGNATSLLSSALTANTSLAGDVTLGNQGTSTALNVKGPTVNVNNTNGDGVTVLGHETGGTTAVLGDTSVLVNTTGANTTNVGHGTATLTEVKGAAVSVGASTGSAATTAGNSTGALAVTSSGGGNVDVDGGGAGNDIGVCSGTNTTSAVTVGNSSSTGNVTFQAGGSGGTVAVDAETLSVGAAVTTAMTVGRTAAEVELDGSTLRSEATAEEDRTSDGTARVITIAASASTTDATAGTLDFDLSGSVTVAGSVWHYDVQVSASNALANTLTTRRSGLWRPGSTLPAGSTLGESSEGLGSGFTVALSDSTSKLRLTLTPTAASGSTEWTAVGKFTGVVA